MQNRSLLFAAPFALLTAGSIMGCGSSAEVTRVDVVPVSGKVLYRGQPAAGAEVTLHATDGAPQLAPLHPHGVVQPDGSFQLSTYELNDGAPEGSFALTVHWPDESYQPRTPEEKENFLMGGLKPDKLRGRFTNPQTSDLHVTIDAGQPQLAPLQLQ
jgi:hypothetical protein